MYTITYGSLKKENQENPGEPYISCTICMFTRKRRTTYVYKYYKKENPSYLYMENYFEYLTF